MTTLTITHEQREGKTRAFRAELLAYAAADALWDCGSVPDDGVRPVFAAFAASELELRAFEANLRASRPAVAPGNYRPLRVELLKSAGYTYARQRQAGGAAVLTAHLPALFEHDPGLVDPAGIRCVVLPPANALPRVDRYAAAEAATHVRTVRDAVFGDAKAPEREEVAALAPLAELTAAYLYPRTTRPLPPDLGWRLQFFCALLARGLAARGQTERRGYYHDRAELPWDRRAHWTYREVGVADLGFAPGVAVSASHNDFNELYLAQIAAWHGARARRRAA